VVSRDVVMVAGFVDAVAVWVEGHVGGDGVLDSVEVGAGVDGWQNRRVVERDVGPASDDLRVASSLLG